MPNPLIHAHNEGYDEGYYAGTMNTKRRLHAHVDYLAYLLENLTATNITDITLNQIRGHVHNLQKETRQHD